MGDGEFPRMDPESFLFGKYRARSPTDASPGLRSVLLLLLLPSSFVALSKNEFMAVVVRDQMACVFLANQTVRTFATCAVPACSCQAILLRACFEGHTFAACASACVQAKKKRTFYSEPIEASSASFFALASCVPFSIRYRAYYLLAPFLSNRAVRVSGLQAKWVT